MDGQQPGSNGVGVRYGVRRLLKQLAQLLLFGALAVASYQVFSHYVLQSVQVVGPSMAPTLRDSDYYFLNRWSYYLTPPKRSDIVVIKDPTDGAFVVKRIIAMPGESVLFKDGEVYVNGRKLIEPYLRPRAGVMTQTTTNGQLVLCGKDQYFVLGDNRENSYDSRAYGPVRRENILGVVMR